ncbi:MAG: hypothetical protein MO852_05080 [Candidatus Devosia euplotis]|nr:hypothetical protein [Candidatus Devosia euplotis]
MTLPDGAVIADLVGYAGPVGFTGRAVSVKRNADNIASFRANRPLGAGEGMTIAIAFNKSIIEFPAGLDALS